MLLIFTTLLVISMTVYLLDPSRSMSVLVIHKLIEVVLIVAAVRYRPSSWIFPRWSRASEAARKRARLRDWRYWNKSPVSPTLRNEAWFQKPQ